MPVSACLPIKFIGTYSEGRQACIGLQPKALYWVAQTVLFPCDVLYYWFHFNSLKCINKLQIRKSMRGRNKKQWLGAGRIFNHGQIGGLQSGMGTQIQPSRSLYPTLGGSAETIWEFCGFLPSANSLIKDMNGNQTAWTPDHCDELKF